MRGDFRVGEEAAADAMVVVRFEGDDDDDDFVGDDDGVGVRVDTRNERLAFVSERLS